MHWGRLIFFFIGFTACFGSSAQNIIPRFETIGVNEGLSQSSVYSIYQDSKGFMWFGTADGLNRFDGKNVKVYSVKGKTVAYSNFIRGNLSEDKQGRIWFSNETGIFCYDPLSEQISRKVDFENYRWTEGLLIDAKDNFYIVDPMAGIYVYQIATGHFSLTKFRFRAPGFLSVFITTNRKNTIWLKDQFKSGLYAFNTESGTIKYLDAAVPTFGVFYSGTGQLCHTTSAGKLLITDTLLQPAASLAFSAGAWKPNDVQDIRRDAYHRLWLTTLNNGLLCYNETTGKLINYLHHTYQEKSLPINILSTLYIDRANNLWVSTDGAGVCKVDLKPPKFNLFPLNEGDYPQMKDYFVKCFYEDGQGRIWFGTQNSGLNCFDPANGQFQNYNRPAGKNETGSVVSSIFRDRRGQIWMSRNSALLMCDSQMNTIAPVAISGSPVISRRSAFIYKIMQRQNGDLLAVTQAGLVMVKRTGKSYEGHFCMIKPYSYALMTDIVEMPDSTIWVASPIRGLMHYRIDNDLFTLLETRLPSVDLRSIHQDELNPGVLWVGTGMGLVMLNTVTGGQVIYDERNGMAGGCAYGALEDNRHNLWISTNKGLYFFNRKTGIFQNYTVSDGLQSNEFNTQAFYKSKSGNLYFGGIKGFNWFKTGEINTHKPSPPGLAITTINVENRPYVKDTSFIRHSQMVLPYYLNDLSFRFAALDFTRPQANRIRYMLLHWDKTWNTAEDEVRYANLPPGKYLLKVKAANSDGVWSAEQQLAIIITAPFWQTAWFYAAEAVLGLAAIIYITWLLTRRKVRKRLRELEKQQAINSERDRISRDMHDEIGSGLTHIALLSELIETQHEGAAAIRHDIGSVAVAARKLVENMGEIIWALNPQNDSAGNLLAYTREQMQYYYGGFNFRLSINFPEPLPEIKLSNEQRRNLYLVTKEGLNNVLKHAGATRAALSAVFMDNILRFEIKDNGIGLNGAAGKSGGNGCKNMQKRMEAIGGQIEWISGSEGLTLRYWLAIQ